MCHDPLPLTHPQFSLSQAPKERFRRAREKKDWGVRRVVSLPVVRLNLGGLTALVSFFSPPSVGGWRVRNSPAPWLFSLSPTRCFLARLQFPPPPLLSLPRRIARRSSSACCARACALRVSSKGLLCPRPPFSLWRSNRLGLCSLRPCSPGCVAFSLFPFFLFFY